MRKLTLATSVSRSEREAGCFNQAPDQAASDSNWTEPWCHNPATVSTTTMNTTPRAPKPLLSFILTINRLPLVPLPSLICALPVSSPSALRPPTRDCSIRPRSSQQSFSSNYSCLIRAQHVRQTNNPIHSPPHGWARPSILQILTNP